MYLVVRLLKIGVGAEIFTLECAEVFDSFLMFTQPRLQIALGRRLCHFVDVGLGLIETQPLYREQGIFHICTISVQNIAKITLHTAVSKQHETPAGSARFCCLTAYPCIGQIERCNPSVCLPVHTIYSKS